MTYLVEIDGEVEWEVFDIRCPHCKRFVPVPERFEVRYKELEQARAEGREPSWGDIWPTLTIRTTCKKHGEIEASWSSL